MILDLSADYGHDVTSAEGARAHLRSVSPRAWRRPVRGPGEYVAVVHRLADRRGIDMAGIDGRLIAVGYCHVAPTVWLDGAMGRWLAYWARAAKRPDVVGSSYNPAPEHVYRAMRAGVPASLASTWTPRDGRRGHVSSRGVRRLREARAAALWT